MKNLFDIIFKKIEKYMAKIVLLTGPSGVGKGTIEKELFKDSSLNLSFSVSATTRKKREGEIEGEHYHFIKKREFEKLIDDDAFIEFSKHFNNYYGTLYKEIESKLNEGKNVLVEVETNGAINIINKLKQDKKDDLLLSIFIIPPSLEELEKRIRSRNSETEEQIIDRLERAKEEIKYKIYFQHVIKNDNINITTNKIKDIIKKGNI